MNSTEITETEKPVTNNIFRNRLPIQVAIFTDI